MAVTTPRLAVADHTEPASQYVSEALVKPFLQPDFDAADYLNSALPPLATSSMASRGRAVPLSDLSAQLQTLLSQLSAQTSRLSNTLTQLTDEIIRSGSRLAYEVEVLRGETIGWTDALQTGLKKDIEHFVPPSDDVHEPQEAGVGVSGDGGQPAPRTGDVDHADHAGQDGARALARAEPEFLERLRTLTTVRERLDSVVKTFGLAMQWTVAPSELSLGSSLISVSGPDSSDASRSREEKGKEYSEQLRHEINDLLATGLESLEAASARVDGLRELAEVWKGTSEEKARLRLVDSLQKLVDEKQKVLGKTAGDRVRRPGVSPGRAHDYRYDSSDGLKVKAEGGSGYGFLQNLRNLKNEMYSE